MDNLLFDKYPLMVSPKLAEIIGLNEALFLQQIHFWIGKKAHLHDGVYWTYGSAVEWQKQFKFWSLATVRRTITSLENLGVLVVGNYNKKRFDKTKWYTINYKKLQSMSNAFTQNEQTYYSDCVSPSTQNEQTNTLDLPKTSTKNNNTSFTHTPVSKQEKDKQLREDFEKLWLLYPRKENKEQAFKAYRAAIKDGVTNKEIQSGIIGYRRQIDVERTERRYVKKGGNWFAGKLWQNDYSSFMPQHREAIECVDVDDRELSDDEAADWGDLDA